MDSVPTRSTAHIASSSDLCRRSTSHPRRRDPSASRPLCSREFLIDHVRTDDARRSRVAITPEERERRRALEHAKLRRIVAYADTVGCLRATILRYFGDPAAREPCEACGTCDRRERIGEADRLFLRKMLSGVARAPRTYGRRKIAAMLVGHTEGLPAPAGGGRGVPPRRRARETSPDRGADCDRRAGSPRRHRAAPWPTRPAGHRGRIRSAQHFSERPSGIR